MFIQKSTGKLIITISALCCSAFPQPEYQKNNYQGKSCCSGYNSRCRHCLRHWRCRCRWNWGRWRWSRRRPAPSVARACWVIMTAVSGVRVGYRARLAGCSTMLWRQRRRRGWGRVRACAVAVAGSVNAVVAAWFAGSWCAGSCCAPPGGKAPARAVGRCSLAACAHFRRGSAAKCGRRAVCHSLSENRPTHPKVRQYPCVSLVRG